MVITLKHMNIPLNYKTYFIVISLIAIISGSLFYFKISASNQEVIKTYIESYFLFNEYNSFLNVFFFNFMFFLLIWLLGLSIGGSILITFLYFVKIFLLSTSVSAIISLEEKNSVFKAFLYVFPNQIISVFIYALLSIIAINFSFLLFQTLFKKKEINFKLLFRNYNKAFLILFMVIIVVICYQVFINPMIFKLFIK